MYKSLFFALLFISLASYSQKGNKYDSTVKMGKAGYRITCMNRNMDRNTLNIRPIGFKSEVREANLELRGRVVSTEIDDLNNDGFPDIIIFVMDANNKLSLFSIASRDNERIEPIYFPDITNDMQLSKGYRGKDEYKLVEGVLFRKFPIFEADTAIKTPTNKVRQIMYRVVSGDQGTWRFKSFRSFDLVAD
ncbi:MAG: hypothetical protein EB092_02295 [Chitinophagia bacterium]|nr:hypothetical protein [Chitinophagia bacterium]